MKKVTWLLMGLCFLITAAMVSLFRSGISLRAATLIKPSELNSVNEVTEALVVRLYPEFQSKKILLVAPSAQTKDWAIPFLVSLRERLQKTPLAGEIKFAISPNECEKKCVFYNPTDNSVPEKFQTELTKEDSSVFRLHLWEFSRNETWKPECESMQRLNEECIRAVSIRESLRKMKDPSKKYFFLKKYNHNEYYLFLEALEK